MSNNKPRTNKLEINRPVLGEKWHINRRDELKQTLHHIIRNIERTNDNVKILTPFNLQVFFDRYFNSHHLTTEDIARKYKVKHGKQGVSMVTKSIFKLLKQELKQKYKTYKNLKCSKSVFFLLQSTILINEKLINAELVHDANSRVFKTKSEASKKYGKANWDLCEIETRLSGKAERVFSHPTIKKIRFR